MSSDVTSKPKAISEMVFCLLVRFFFGAVLSISVSWFATILLLTLGDVPRIMVKSMLDTSIFSFIGFTAVCCLFARWQWKRIPKRGFTITIDSLAALTLIIVLNNFINGRL